MLRALQVLLIIFGVAEIVLGLLLIIFPDQAASMSGTSQVSGYTKYTMASLGICLIVPSVYIIIAALNPLRHINWVKFTIAWCILGALVGLYSIVKGNAEFSHVGTQIIMDAVFAVIFLALYPWRVRSSVKATA